VLGPLLFTVHIDDIDDFVRLIELLKKFADDTKGLKLIRNIQDREALQRTLDELCRWAEMWGMQYNIEKCKIMHVGRSNPGYEYSMNGKILKTVSEETDIGVIVQSNLKPGKQCQRAANVATGVLKTIWCNFYYRDKKVYLNLYKQYVRPHLEFSVTAWAPWLESDNFFSSICLFTKTVLYNIYNIGSRITIFRDAGAIIYPLAGNMMARG
jgi:hypothetical protein